MMLDLAEAVAASGATIAASAPAPLDLTTYRALPAVPFPAAAHANCQQQQPFTVTPGSGVVVAVVGMQDQRLRLLLSPALAWQLAGVDRPARSPAQLVSRRVAVRETRVKLRVCAGAATLGLSDLLQLVPGQVVRLDLKPGQPFLLEAAGQAQTAGHAWLGRIGQNKAIQLNHPTGSTT